MKVVIQRSNNANVKINNEIKGKIDYGMVILVGFTDGDNEEVIDYIVNKVINLRIFDDECGIMNKSIKDIGGSILSISQFTLYADTKKGNRPSYVNALSGDKATVLYDLFNKKLKENDIHIETGVFGAEMMVSLENNGPVTIIIEKGGNLNEKK